MTFGATRMNFKLSLIFQGNLILFIITKISFALNIMDHHSRAVHILHIYFDTEVNTIIWVQHSTNIQEIWFIYNSSPQTMTAPHTPSLSSNTLTDFSWRACWPENLLTGLGLDRPTVPGCSLGWRRHHTSSCCLLGKCWKDKLLHQPTSNTFGWNILERNLTTGSLLGYSSLNSRVSLNVPSAKGVSSGPQIRAFQRMMSFLTGAPDIPFGGSSTSLLKSLANRRLAVVAILLYILLNIALVALYQFTSSRNYFVSQFPNSSILTHVDAITDLCDKHMANESFLNPECVLD